MKPKARSGQIRFALRDHLSRMWREASAHAQLKFEAVKAKVGQGQFCRIQQAYDMPTTWLRNICSNLKILLLSRNQTNTKWGRKVYSTTWPDLFFLFFSIMGRIRKGSDLPEKKVGVTEHPTKIFAQQVLTQRSSAIYFVEFSTLCARLKMTWYARA